MRRSPRDVRLGRVLGVGQLYRSRETGRLHKVRQVHRADCEVELAELNTDGTPTGVRLMVTFAGLREQFVWYRPLRAVPSPGPRRAA